MRILRSVEQLSSELDAADAASKRSHAEYAALLDQIVLDPRAVIGDFPSDPTTPAYRDAQLSLYQAITGRSYEVASEETPFDTARMMRYPFPYTSQDPVVVGNYLMTYGNLIKTLSLPMHARILEIGSGYGPLTYHLASMGHSVTCVDMSENLLSYIRARTHDLPGHVETIVSDMNSLDVQGSYDVILFFESFHHCADHLGLLRKLPDLLEPGGAVVFAGEPIVPENTPAVPYPWGLRVDGLSLWFASRLGWLELGFEDTYLHNLLEKLGWSVVRKPSGPVSTMGIWIAKGTTEDSRFARAPAGARWKVWQAADRALHSQMDFLPSLKSEVPAEGGAGYLLYGPYTTLDTGFYEVHWHGEAEHGSRFVADVACSGGTRILRSESIVSGEPLSEAQATLLARARFKVDEPAADFEFRIRLDSPARIRIDRVELHKC